MTRWALVAASVGLLITTSWATGPGSPDRIETESREAARSMIVQGRDVAAVAEAVRGAGGEVTHELGIIRAVGARLTPPQLTALSDSPAVRRIYSDSAVRLATGGGGSKTVRDEFSVTSFTNNDGTASWEGAWIEHDVERLLVDAVVQAHHLARRRHELDEVALHDRDRQGPTRDPQAAGPTPSP